MFVYASTLPGHESVVILMAVVIHTEGGQTLAYIFKTNKPYLSFMLMVAMEKLIDRYIRDDMLVRNLSY